MCHFSPRASKGFTQNMVNIRMAMKAVQSPSTIAFGKTNCPLSRDFYSKECQEILQDTGYHQPDYYQTYSPFLIMILQQD